MQSCRSVIFWSGAVVTALLFNLGKFVIGLYLPTAR
jgi:uncharacterized BrkB/YihY/UPF0761 family membrane protein